MPPTQGDRITEVEQGLGRVNQRITALDSSISENQEKSEARFDAVESSIDGLRSDFDSRFSGLEILLKKLIPHQEESLDRGSPLPPFPPKTAPPVSSSDFEVVGDNRDSTLTRVKRGTPDIDNGLNNSGQKQQVYQPSSTSFNRDTSVRKVEMPIFDGTNAFGWLARIEHFFRIGCYAEEEKLRLVSLSIDGPVLSWFNWRMSRQPFQSWTAFKNDLLQQFSEHATLGRRLFGLQQTGSLASFITEFHELSAQTPHLTDEDLENIFLNGLNPALRELVLMLNPHGLMAVIETAIRLEPTVICKVVADASRKDNQQQYGSRSYVRPAASSSWRTRQIPDSQSQTSSNTTSAVPVYRPPMISRSENPKGRLNLSADEYAEKKKRGLCFTCDVPYYPGHKCPNKYLQVLTIIDGCEVELVEDPIDGDVSLFQKSPECLSLSLSSFMGFPSSTTTKIQGVLGRLKVQGVLGQRNSI